MLLARLFGAAIAEESSILNGAIVLADDIDTVNSVSG